MNIIEQQALIHTERRFRLSLMIRKRRLRLTPIPKIKVKIGTNKRGYVHCLFGSHGKDACPTPKYDENGDYIKDQPWFAWISSTMHSPEYNQRWNKELRTTFWNYIRVNIKNIHPADLA